MVCKHDDKEVNTEKREMKDESEQIDRENEVIV